MESQLVPYIVLSKNKKILAEYVEHRNSGNILNFITKYKNHLSGIKSRSFSSEIQVFDPTFIKSFEHSFGFTTTGGDKSSTTAVVEITFIDPAADAENFLIKSMYSTENVVPKSSSFPDHDFKGAAAALTGGRKVLGSAEIDDFVDKRMDKNGFWTGVGENVGLIFGYGDDYAVEEAIRKNAENMAVGQNAFLNSLKFDVVPEDETTSELYWISYGIGRNSFDWSPPMFIMKNEASLKTNASGGRELVFKFVPHPANFRSKDSVKSLNDDWVKDKVRETTFGDGKYKLVAYSDKIRLVTKDNSGKIKEREDLDLLYTEIIIGLYQCIYDAYRVAMFGRDDEKNNVLMLLPNYHNLLKHLWEEQKTIGMVQKQNPETKKTEKSPRGAFSIVSDFLGTLGEFAFVAKKPLILPRANLQEAADKDATENKEGNALKALTSNDYEFFITLTIREKINPQSAFEKVFIGLHPKAKNESAEDINNVIPQYVFLEENNPEYVNIFKSSFNTEVNIYGRDNPINPNLGIFYVIGARKLIDKYFYYRNPSDGLPYDINGKKIKSDELKDELGVGMSDLFNINYRPSLYDRVAEYMKSNAAAGGESVFGNIYEMPKITYTDTTLSDQNLTAIFGTTDISNLSQDEKFNKIQEVLIKAKIPVFSLGLKKSNVLEINMDIDKVYQHIWLNNFGFNRKLLGAKSLLADSGALKRDDFKEYNIIFNLIKEGKEKEAKGLLSKAESTKTLLFNSAAVMNVMGEERSIKGADILAHAGAPDVVSSEDDEEDVDNEEIRTAFANAYGLTSEDIDKISIDNYLEKEGKPSGLVDRAVAGDVKSKIIKTTEIMDQNSDANEEDEWGNLDDRSENIRDELQDIETVTLTKEDADKINKYIDAYNDVILKEIRKKTKTDIKEFKNLAKKLHKEKQINFILETMKSLAKIANDEPEVTLSHDSNGVTQDKLHSDLTSLVMSQPLVGRIKTLPYFGLSDYKTVIRNPCFLFGAEPVATFGNNNVSLNKGRFWFNGIYSIVGYKHTISGNSIYSEFSIMRTAQK